MTRTPLLQERIMQYMHKQRQWILLGLVALWIGLAVSCQDVNGTMGVTYDSRSLIVNGKREIFFSGSVHYPRSPPQMWPDILHKAKHGGLNVIQTYVFWNIHEPERGQYNFEGNYDLVKFIKMIGQQGMYATLRVGPYIQAEWSYGGFPYWLREVPNITFRTNNQPFKSHMKRFTKKVIRKLQDEKLFASQGGPIILSQIENEYDTVHLAFKEQGTKYIQWAARMAEKLKTGVPWVMCKQKDAPESVISTCNGRSCGDTFVGPNGPNKPILWTENWTTQYRSFGDPPSKRSAEDIAYAVARFFSKNGTLVNYYMYYGGTNFGRTASAFVTTRYYDEAPLDEFGLERNPVWGHLKALHTALRMCKRPLLSATPSVQNLGEKLEARIYGNLGTSDCAAFLANNNTRLTATAIFGGSKYELPPRSISILPDCKTVVYNTRSIVSQHSSRNYQESTKANKNFQWEMFRENIPNISDTPIKSKSTIELLTATKDTTDYLWHTTNIELDEKDLPVKKDVVPVLEVLSLGHVLHAFVNGEYIGTAHGDVIKKGCKLKKALTLKTGVSTISVLSSTVGYPNSGSYLERRIAGVHAVLIKDLNAGTLELSDNGWGHQVGLTGEELKLFTQGGSQRAQWTKPSNKKGPSITWYKGYFDAPEGDDPVALDLGTMSKGMAWVNGNSIGRYWSSFLSPLGKPSQSVYHVPRAFLNPSNNLLVLFEEIGGNPDGIKILTVNRDTVCSYINENHPPNLKSWKKEAGVLRTVIDNPRPTAELACPKSRVIVKVEFASFGDPSGVCGNFTLGDCTLLGSQKVVEQFCLGKNSCSVPVEEGVFNKEGGSCPHITKSLAIQVKCGNKDLNSSFGSS